MEANRSNGRDRARVLVVDDESSYCDSLARFLRREGYDVRTCSNASDALALGCTFRPRVILADWMLEDQMHGLQLAEELRDLTPGLRILLMTGYLSKEIREQAARADVFRFLEKPFGLQEVSAAIRDATT